MSKSKSIRGSDGRFITRVRRSKVHKLLGYADREYRESIKKILRSMSLKELEKLFKARTFLGDIIEDTISDFASGYWGWEGDDEDEKKYIKEEKLKLLRNIFNDIKGEE